MKTQFAAALRTVSAGSMVIVLFALAARAQTAVPAPKVVVTDGKPSGTSTIVSINPSTQTGTFAVVSSDSVMRLSFASREPWLLAGTRFGALDVVDTRTWMRTRRIQTRQGMVTAVAVSPDGQTAATGGDDKTIKIWRIASGELVTTIPGLTDNPQSLSFSRTGQLLAAAVNGGRGLVYDTSKGSLVKDLPAGAVAFSAAGDVLVTILNDKLSFWDVKSWTMTRELSDSDGWLSQVVLDEQSDRLIAGGIRFGTRIWKLSTGHQTLHIDSGFVAALGITADRRWVLTAGNGFVKVWSAESGKQLCTTQELPLMSIALSADGHWVAAAVANTVQVWAVDELIQGCEQPGR